MSVVRSTPSVVEPKNSLLVPLRPCELMTIRSASVSRATLRISTAGLPTATWTSTDFGPAAVCARPASMKRWISRLVAWASGSLPAAATADSSGSSTLSTTRRAPKWSAMAEAYCNAVRDASEKSTGQTISGG